MATELMGVDADEIMKLRNEQMFQKVNDIFNGVAYKNLKVLVKARKQIFNNEAKVVFFATRVYPHSFSQENEALLDRLELYDKSVL